MSNPETPKYIATDEQKEQARQLIKNFLKKQNTSIYKLAQILHEKYGRSASVSNLLNKLDRASFKMTELMDIADAFGYELQIVPKSCDSGHVRNNNI